MVEIIKIIKLQFPDRAIELSESLQLLNESISSTIDDISDNAAKAFATRNFVSIDKYKELAEKGVEYEKIIENYINLLEFEEDDIIDEYDESNNNQEQTITNYDDYRVDNQVEHTLFEDWTYKKPYGFKFIRNNIIKANQWNELFIKTCETLYDIDSIKFVNFEYLSYVNGKKKKYFSKNPDNLRKPYKIRDEIFVEINHSANTFRTIILKMLKEYKYKSSDYKVYLRADYTELNRRSE